jgi:repressor LexA
MPMTIEQSGRGPARLPDDSLLLPRQLVGDGSLFAVRVSGDAMIGAAIADGDWAVIRQQDDARSGELVAVLLDGADGPADIRMLRRAADGSWLMSDNPAYPPVPAADATILGRVVSVLRRI